MISTNLGLKRGEQTEEASEDVWDGDWRLAGG